MSSTLRDLIAAQVDEVRRFWKSKTIRTALIVPWAESYTAAFMGPVYPFFLQALGMTAISMGQLRTITLALQFCSAPIFGCLLDAYGPFVGIALPSSICSIGCAIKAMANGWSALVTASVFSGLSGAKVDMAMAVLTKHTAPPRRTLAVSASRVQMQALGLLGTLCFTPFNAFLEQCFPTGLLRFRIEISLCMIGCGFGVLVLLLARDTLSYAPEVSEADENAGHTDASSDTSEDPGAAAAAAASGKATGKAAARAERSSLLGSGGAAGGAICGTASLPPALGLVALSLFFCAMLQSSLSIAWPLFMKAHFGWAEKQYALVLPLQQALAFALIAAPYAHETLGSARAVGLLGSVSTLAYALGFLLQSSQTLLAKVSHVACMLIGGVCNSALELVLTAIASTFATPSAQGRLFAVVAISRHAGSISGNLLGTALFQYSLDLPSDAPVVMRGGALLTTLIAGPALVNVAMLARCALNTGYSSRGGLSSGSKSTTSGDEDEPPLV